MKLQVKVEDRTGLWSVVLYCNGLPIMNTALFYFKKAANEHAKLVRESIKNAEYLGKKAA